MMPRSKPEVDCVLEVRGLTMEFKTGSTHLRVLEDLQFAATSGDFLAVIGPNGCGKTTLVRLLAGLLCPSKGMVLQHGCPVTCPDRSRLLMFQRPTLFPWMTVQGNIDFALRARRVPVTPRRQIVERQIKLLGLAGFEKSYPYQLSGGMQQRAELARAMALSPKVLLMDEPFAALDSLTRIVIQDELARLRAHHETTFIMITHDVEEAVFLADQVLLLTRRPARVKQLVRIDRGNVPAGRWRSSGTFTALCNQILAALREEVDETHPPFESLLALHPALARERP